MSRKIKFVQQFSETECGICCISMLASYYGYIQPLSFYRDKLNVGRDGSSFSDFVKVFDQCGFKSYVFRKKTEELDCNVFDDPAICYVNNSHFVVVLRKKEKLIVYDSAKGENKMTIDQLRSIYSGYYLKINPLSSFKEVYHKEKVFKEYIKILKPTYRLFTVVLLLSAFTYGVMLYVPIIIQNIIDKTYLSLNVNVLFLTLILAVSFLLISILRDYFIVKFEVEADKVLNEKTIFHLLQLPYKYFETRNSGNILYKIGLLSSIKNIISNSLITEIISIGMFIVSFCYILLLNKWIALILFLILCMLGFYIIRFNRILLNYNQIELDKNSLITSMEIELISSILTIKSMCQEENWKASFSNNYADYLKSFGIRELMSKVNNSVLNCFQYFFPLLIFVLVSLLLKEYLTIGEIVSFYTLSNINISKAISCFQNMSNISIVKNMLIRINDILLEKSEINGNIELKKLKEIELKDVDFSYSDSNKSSMVLENISMKFESNKTYAIVGESGAGKSTLIKLLIGLNSPNSGTIMYNGTPGYVFSNESIRKSIGVVLQDSTLFNNTIRDNILLHNQNISNKMYNNVLEQVAIKSFIDNLPMKDKTIISETGTNFSGGQKQRILLARTLVRSPDVLILDEATSAVDSINESIINDCLKSYEGIKIIVAHRLSTIKNADWIYVLSDGKLVESGRHNELLKNKGYYYKLYRSSVSNGESKNEV